MTVKELIEELSLIRDKSKEIEIMSNEFNYSITGINKIIDNEYKTILVSKKYYNE